MREIAHRGHLIHLIAPLSNGGEGFISGDGSWLPLNIPGHLKNTPIKSNRSNAPARSSRVGLANPPAKQALKSKESKYPADPLPFPAPGAFQPCLIAPKESKNQTIQAIEIQGLRDLISWK